MLISQIPHIMDHILVCWDKIIIIINMSYFVDPGVPYTIMVTAINSGGIGETVSAKKFSKELCEFN